MPLILSLADDGKSFKHNCIIPDEEYKLKQKVLWKDGQYGYPYTIVYNGYRLFDHITTKRSH